MSQQQFARTPRFPSIGDAPKTTDRATSNWMQRMQESIEMLTGQRFGPQPWQLATYVVASLPANNTGLLAYASDGCKPGEATGQGTGVLVYSDKTKWVSVHSGVAVTK